MGALIFSGLFGLAFAASVVQVALWCQRYSARQAAIWVLLSVSFVWLVAKIVGYFMLRMYINDHYEADDELITILVVRPATVGALLGGLTGALIARHSATEHRRRD